jgi:NitT/TauT family transport system substrate-binding protein
MRLLRIVDASGRGVGETQLKVRCGFGGEVHPPSACSTPWQSICRKERLPRGTPLRGRRAWVFSRLTIERDPWEQPDMSSLRIALTLMGIGLGAAVGPASTLAADKVKVGVFPISSSLPYFVAIERGYFKELGIEPETITLMGGPPNVAALMTNQIDVSAVLVTLEGLNANVKKPGVAMYIGMHSQTATWKMEQFVVRSGLKVKSLKDLKGLKLMSAPGPANVNTAKGVLAKVGLKDGDYSIVQLDMGQHVNAIKAGTFDGGYTLEPSASIMQKLGVALVVEAGVIAKYILGDPQADAWAAGCAFSIDFIKGRPEVAKRFAGAWSKAIDYIRAEPQAAQKYLAKNTMTPDDLVDVVPMLGYRMTKDFSPKQLEYLQTFADFGTHIGVVPEKVDVRKFLAAF